MTDTSLCDAASALVVAREFGVGVKIVWRDEPVCDNCGTTYQPFVGSWHDLFSEPQIRHANNFPGEVFVQGLAVMLVPGLERRTLLHCRDKVSKTASVPPGHGDKLGTARHGLSRTCRFLLISHSGG